MTQNEFDTFLVLTYGTYSEGVDFENNYRQYLNRLPTEVVARASTLAGKSDSDVFAAVRQALEEYHEQNGF